MIEKIKLGKTNLNISRVVYGGIVSTNETQQDSDKYVSYAVDRGVNYFDVAPAYGDAQIKVGNSLKPYRRNINLACKTAERKEVEAAAQMKESLELLHTDYFDVYQLHALTTNEDLERSFSSDGIMNFLIKAKKEGIVRNIGFSAHNEEIARKALTLYDFDTVLYPINWALGYCNSMGDGLTDDAKERNMGILALKSMALRHWNDTEERKFPKCWYKPVDIDIDSISDILSESVFDKQNNHNDINRLAISALKYTLSKGAHTIVPPGYFSYFAFVLEHLDECLKNPFNEDDHEFLNQELLKIKDQMIF